MVREFTMMAVVYRYMKLWTSDSWLKIQIHHGTVGGHMCIIYKRIFEYQCYDGILISFYHTLSYFIIFYHVLSCFIIFYHVLSSFIMFYHVLSYFIMFYHVLSSSDFDSHLENPKVTRIWHGLQPYRWAAGARALGQDHHGWTWKLWLSHSQMTIG